MDDTEAGKRAFDEWVQGIGGFAGRRYQALYREALEFAGPDGCTRYLAMAMQLDGDHAAWKRGREARKRAEAARRSTESAAAATLQRVTEIKLAADQLAGHPRLASDPDFSTRPGMGSAEVALELRAAMGLASRMPTEYQAMLPPVGDLAHAIGVKL